MNVQSVKEAQGRRLWMAGVMLATLTASMSSHAGIIAFDNAAGPSYFDWSPDAGGDSYLDVFLSASNQLNVSTPSSLKQVNQGDISEVGFGNFQVATGGFENLFAIGIAEGTLIDDSFTWAQSGFIFVDGFGAEIAEGQPTYLAIRFDLGAGFQYGWVGVERTGLTLDAFAWGYETQVGVPIAAGAGIPAPGVLSLLMLAGVAGRRRRRA